MKLLQKLALYAMAFVLLIAAGCARPPQADSKDPLAGRWQDVYGLTEYEFYGKQQLKMKAMGMVTFDGSYSVDGDQMTVTLSILGRPDSHCYTFLLQGNRFFLNQTEFVRKQ